MKNYRVVEVLFMNNEKPYYFKTEINDLKRGEVVIVETVGGLQRASINKYVSIDNFAEESPKRWVLCRNRVLTGDIKDYNLKSKLMKLLGDIYEN